MWKPVINKLYKENQVPFDALLQPVLEYTHAELLALKNANQLKPGQQYKITDFKTKYTQPVTNLVVEAENFESLILTATSPNAFDINVCSIKYPNDLIHYDITDTICEGKTYTRGFIEFTSLSRIFFIENYQYELRLDGVVYTSPIQQPASQYEVISMIKSWIDTLQVGTTHIGPGGNLAFYPNAQIFDSNLLSGKTEIITNPAVGTENLRKGKINYRKDDKGNESLYDIRYVLNENDVLTIGNNCSFNKIGNNQVGNIYVNNIGILENSNENIIKSGKDIFLATNCCRNIIGFNADTIEILDYSNSNTIGNDCINIALYGSFNHIGNNVSNLYVNTAEFKNNTIADDIDFTGIDFSLATHVFADFHCNIFKNSNGDIKLSYINAFDEIIITDVNA